MDPQQRLLLERGYQALHAGQCDRATLRDSIDGLVGVVLNTTADTTADTAADTTTTADSQSQGDQPGLGGRFLTVGVTVADSVHNRIGPTFVAGTPPAFPPYTVLKAVAVPRERVRAAR